MQIFFTMYTLQLSAVFALILSTSQVGLREDKTWRKVTGRKKKQVNWICWHNAYIYGIFTMLIWHTVRVFRPWSFGRGQEDGIIVHTALSLLKIRISNDICATLYKYSETGLRHEKY
jgi:hypothetical protein